MESKAQKAAIAKIKELISGFEKRKIIPGDFLREINSIIKEYEWRIDY